MNVNYNSGAVMPEQAIAENKHVKITQRDGAHVISLIKRNLIEPGDVEATLKAITDLIEEKKPGAPQRHLIIDFANVDHLSSQFLHGLIQINNKVRAKGDTLKLAEIDPQIHEVFVITKLHQLFDIKPTLAEAIQATKEQGQAR
jgi:anti-anti-sigma factor